MTQHTHNTPHENKRPRDEEGDRPIKRMGLEARALEEASREWVNVCLTMRVCAVTGLFSRLWQWLECCLLYVLVVTQGAGLP